MDVAEGINTVFRLDDEDASRVTELARPADAVRVEHRTFADRRLPGRVEAARPLPVGVEAFLGCRRFRRVPRMRRPAYGPLRVPIPTIGLGAFQDCAILRSLRLPVDVRRAGALDFAGCVSLGTVRIPDSPDNIGERCFAGIPGFDCRPSKRWCCRYGAEPLLNPEAPLGSGGDRDAFPPAGPVSDGAPGPALQSCPPVQGHRGTGVRKEAELWSAAVRAA